MLGKVLVQDEDRLLFCFLEDKNLNVRLVKNKQMALQLLQEGSFDLIFCDEMEVLRKAKTLYPESLVIILASIPNVGSAIEAMRLGAFDYLTKPIDLAALDSVLERVESDLLLRKEVVFQARGKLERIMTESSVMKQILSDIAKVAKSNASVFICGESGTGKEVIAHAIHFHSHRASHPFIKVNCAAIPESLIESEFFGHEKGSFTGAIDKRIGRFELASKGTLLLDEVSEIPISLQAKLLRAVQEQEFERVGGSKPIQVDVRFISTSNRNMKETVEEKLFREDLYYRLNVVPIQLPPLRERREDIISLGEHFLHNLCLENHKRQKQLSEDAKKMLLDYHWPGNIRELANVLERTVVMDLSDVIEASHLRLEISCPIVPNISSLKGLTLEEVEKKHILDTLGSYNHNRTLAAKALGISLRTLRNKLAHYRLGPVTK
jgi:two-component system response regulator AtoC